MMKKVKTYQTESEAAIDSLVLKDNRIDFQIVKNDGTPYPSITDIYGYSLMVKDSDLEKALASLNNKNELSENDLPESVSPETEESDSPANRRWHFYTGIVLGIIIALLSQWGYSQIRFKLSKFPRVIFRDGLASHIIEDRNKDKKADYWQKFDYHGNAYSEADNNYDGKIDYWWRELDYSTEKEERDSDFNGIPDETAYYKNFIIQRKYLHPNSRKNIRRIQEYSASGIFEKEYLDTDSVPGVNLIRYYNAYGTIVKEEAINDSIVVPD